ncbi:glycosyltransferase [Cyanobium sp. WAJ14-Wanaka]|uniref:glycosyltransferase n=1 Tax=Cyanobium sp. WAJ14-Wanaka TaxID=2823725 RepID=UPI0020CE38F1|nr:glycosyltransferase [Cyanobium sp. WAJ14-Wanaka]MCP9775643.1 glycosyltransferase [Cyanobium sp. WAJ14-Wanaka]
MRILISHNNYPSQFRRLAPALAEQGHEVVFVAQQQEWHAQAPGPGVRLITYQPHRVGGSEALHPYLRRFEACVLQGQAAYRACHALSQEGWQPDFILNHVGFGNGFYLSDLFPQARRIGLFEWYYNSHGADVDFLRRGDVEPDRAMRLRTWNAQILLELAHCHIGVVPTQWQWQQFPEHLRGHLQVIHEGVDVQRLSQLRSAGLPRPACLPEDSPLEILTYVSRGFEDYRGFPQAMQAIALLQARRPNLHVLIAGSDQVAYGASRSDGRSWGAWAREELPLDDARTHWLGPLQEGEYHQLLACSDVHLYLTVPFVLSWSLIEAMAAGCCLVASATAPVQEVLTDGKSARLVDFFCPEAQAQAIAELLDDQSQRERLAKGAAQAALGFTSIGGLASWSALLSLNSDQTAHSAFL